VSPSTWLGQARRLLAAHPHVDAAPEDIESLLSMCTVRRIPQGETLCREGDPGTRLFVLLAGTITVVKRDVTGTDRHVGDVRAPTLLGQMGIIDRARRTATCTAATDCVVAAMDQGTFQDLVRQTTPTAAALRRLLLSSLTRQMVHGNDRMRALFAARGGASTDPDAPRTGLLQARGVLEGWTDDVGRNPAKD